MFDATLKFRKPRLPPRIIANAENGAFKAPKAPVKKKRVKVADRVNQEIDLYAEWDDSIIYETVATSRRKENTDREQFLIPTTELDELKADQDQDRYGQVAFYSTKI